MSAKAALTRGAFIVFEGCDRSGKSTQCKKLVERLNELGTPAKLMRFPDRTTPIGQKINAYLTNAKDVTDEKIHELFSENRWEAVPAITESLNSGVSLVVDRYAYSGVAFSSAKGLDLEWCKRPDAGLPAPDLVVFLDIPIEDAMRRGEFGTERYETKEFQIKVANQFKLLKADSWKIVDARQTPEAIQAEIEGIALATLKQIAGSSRPLGVLW